MRHGKVVLSQLGLFLMVWAGLLVAASTTARASAQVDTLYAQGSPHGPQMHWKNTNTIFGPPEANCDDSSSPQYAWNDTAASTEFLEVREWDDFTLQAGYVVSSVKIDVHGRYDNPSSRDTFELRVRNTVPLNFNHSPKWTQDDFSCEWRMSEDGAGWDITNLHPGVWTEAGRGPRVVEIDVSGVASGC